MPGKSQDGTASKRSYFAVIPILNRRNKGKIEKNVVKFIHKSSIFKSNPILKTLFIENVRICCIVMETSGKQSIKIICASTPYIFSLICKANPKLGSILTNDKVASCLEFLQESDLEFLLTNVYEATVFLQKGVEKFYPSLCVRLVKDSAFFSEKSFWYCYSVLQSILSATFKFLYDHSVPTFQYLCHQNRKLACAVIDQFPQLMSASLKTYVALAVKLQKAMIVSFRSVNKAIMCFNSVLNYVHAESSVSSILQNLYSFLKSLVAVIHSSNVYTHLEQMFLQLYESYQPSMKEYFRSIFKGIKHVIQFSVPLIKNTIQYILKDIIPSLRTFIESNKDGILIVSNVLKNFICRNSHIIKLLFNEAYFLFYRSAIYLFDFYQAIAPHVIEFSSSAVIYLISCFNFVSENCIFATKGVCSFLNSEYSRKVLCCFSRKIMSILKIICKVIVNAQPYIVLFFRNFIRRLLNLIPIVSPALLAVINEVNSSLFHASNEAVAKSCLAVKRISPSVWCTVKTVVPPTIKATHEIVKSSTHSFIVIYPTVVKGILFVRPELTRGIIVLLSDGNKACLEVATVSYFASCQIKDVAINLSSNLPIVYRAMREVVTTTTYAAIEVSTTSCKAQSRVLSDLKKACQVIHSSVILAEQEILTVYISANSVLYSYQENVPGYKNDLVFSKLIGNRFVKLLIDCAFSNFTCILSKVINTSNRLYKKSVIILLDILKVLIHLCCCLIILVCKNLTIDEGKINSISACLSNLCDICKTLLYMTANGIHSMSKHLTNYLLNMSFKIACNICVVVSKMWYTFKFCVQTIWDEICRLSPQLWSLLEHVFAEVWNEAVHRIPKAWEALKNLSPTVWKIICYLAIYIWRYVSAKSPDVWYSGREFVKLSWSAFLSTSDFMWQHTLSLSSEYWILSRTYLPQVWVVSCSETRRSWEMACCLTENCWNFTMGTFFISWKLFHQSVAKSWKKGLVVSKTVYGVWSTAGSVVRKTVCTYGRSKDYICVILEAAPQVTDFSLNPLSVVKLPNFLKLSNNNLNNCPQSLSDDIISHSIDKSSVRENIKRYACTFLKSLPNIGVSRIMNYETVTPSEEL